MGIFGMQEETRVVRENPFRYEEEVRSLHSDPSQESVFFFSSMLQQNTLNQTTLFEDLLYIEFPRKAKFP